MYSEFKLKYFSICVSIINLCKLSMCLNKVGVKISIQTVLIIFPSVVKKFGILEWSESQHVSLERSHVSKREAK